MRPNGIGPRGPQGPAGDVGDLPAEFAAHIVDYSNPHHVNAHQLGLGSADSPTLAGLMVNGAVLASTYSSPNAIYQLNEGAFLLAGGLPIKWTASGAYYSTPDIGLVRDSAGVLRVSDGGSGYGAVKAKGLDAGGFIRAYNQSAVPTSGPGLEMYYNGAAVLNGYNRTTSAYIETWIDGLPLFLNRNTGGRVIVGTATDDGVNLLQVAGSAAFWGAVTVSHGFPQLVVKDPTAAGINSTQILQFVDSAGAQQGYVYKEAGSGIFAIGNTANADMRFSTNANELPLTLHPLSTGGGGTFNGRLLYATPNTAPTLSANGQVSAWMDESGNVPYLTFAGKDSAGNAAVASGLRTVKLRVNVASNSNAMIRNPGTGYPELLGVNDAESAFTRLYVSGVPLLLNVAGGAVIVGGDAASTDGNAFQVKGAMSTTGSVTSGGQVVANGLFISGGSGAGVQINDRSTSNAWFQYASGDVLRLNLGGDKYTFDSSGNFAAVGNLTAPTLYGGAASGGNLSLGSTSHATKGKILFGTSAYDEVNNRLAIGTATAVTGAALTLAGGHLMPLVDASMDIGGTSNRVRNIFASATVKSSGTGSQASVEITGSAGAASIYFFPNSASLTGQITNPSNGVFRFANGAGTDFGRLQLGGTTSAFPAIKRNAAGIDIRLADDSGYANLSASGGSFGGPLGFYGASPASQPTVAAAATDAATTLALANSIRAALLNLGLAA